MKLTITTEKLSENNLSLGEFIVLLMEYYDISLKDVIKSLEAKGHALPNLFDASSVVLCDNTRFLISRILAESSEEVTNSSIDFNALADKLRECYPDGVKPGTTYPWRSTTEEIAQQLRLLVLNHKFSFTEEEAINAVKEYVRAFNDNKYMRLLKYFILRTDNAAFSESLFMTTIENNRNPE